MGAPEMSLYPDASLQKLKISNNVQFLQQMRFLNRTTRGIRQEIFHVNDSAWPDMWHAQPDKFPSLGVYNAWLLGYGGMGVHITILDDGVEPDHPDLAANYDAANSYDYLYEQQYVNHTLGDFHGTWCAGIVAATKNSDCVLGMAYEAKFSAVKIFDEFYGLTDFGESLALSHNLARTDVYSNSWGPVDDGETFEGPGPLAQEALERAVTEGRDGKGAIFTWAAGNGGIYDDCGCDGYAGSRYTISVTAVGRDQGASWYSEECSSVFIGAYSGDSPDLRISTTDTGGACTNRFQGTSASCPMAAGIIALALEANPELTWRDVQHLIAATASTSGLVRAGWQKNGAGLRVSHVFGFGLINAEAIVNAAVMWNNVSPQTQCTSDVILVDRLSANGVEVVSEHVSRGCDLVQYLEHVEVWISFYATYRGSVQFILTSPAGTDSRLLRPRRFDVSNGTTDWTFMTVMSWGERPMGVWTLRMETTDSSTEFGLNSWRLSLYGVQTAPSYVDAQVLPQSDADETTAGAIAGGVVGGLAVVAFVVVALVYILVGKKAKSPAIHPEASGVVNPSMNARYPEGTTVNGDA
ncbi:furin-like protease kpc-1 [Dreissena polymorpha]|uniref:P/Homo B domain-containing protein n=1 Tax=Dreissena polymorpha TaxID=45954 RepID=A0A9D4H3K4_DREPO|nr:furin-like protease kpc-1 [Dreissena polymorpha]KAH3827948.1 hypothetical protein DPMN_129894 [Dreissena polymorpha]